MILVRYFLLIITVVLGLIPIYGQIDSGGGIASLGVVRNHSSIGGPLATSGTVTGLIEILYPPAPAIDPNQDSDADGLPDAWENQRFGSLTANATADSDRDGTTNLMEYLAGTNPSSAASVFRPTSHAIGGNLVLSVPTVLERSYRVWGNSNLQGAWTHHDTITGDGSTVEWVYSLNQSPKYFLRIEILIPSKN